MTDDDGSEPTSPWRIIRERVRPPFEDLNRHNAVVMPSRPLTDEKFEEHRPYYVHLSVTGRCNARCSGCVNSSITFRGGDRRWLSSAYDSNPQRDATAIVSLLDELDETEATVSFYGGEPLLVPDKIEQIIDRLDARRHGLSLSYMIYTNGQLLGDFIASHQRILPMIWLWSVSIDGTEEQHNRIRPGTDLATIHRNLEILRRHRTGSILMWSTLREEQSLTDCFEEFLTLKERGHADHFFWHWVETDHEFSNLPDYISRYGRDLEIIMESYLSRLREGRLLSIIHLNELILYLLCARERGSSACAVERARNFDIIGGMIHPCADLPPEYTIGHVDDDGRPHINPRDLSSLVDYKIGLGCHECGVHPYCGGRCPVQAIRGSSGRMRDYCQMMRLHVGIVQSYMPDIIDCLGRSGITLQELYDRSAFFAQFTDVTP